MARGDMHGRGHAWGRAWEGCMCGIGVCVARGCVAGGQAGGHVWQGAYMTGETTTAADGNSY